MQIFVLGTSELNKVCFTNRLCIWTALERKLLYRFPPTLELGFQLNQYRFTRIKKMIYFLFDKRTVFNGFNDFDNIWVRNSPKASRNTRI